MKLIMLIILYTTSLPANQVKGFNAFIRLNHIEITNDYDIVGAYLARVKLASNGHLPDTFKRPNHITFSTDSKYSYGHHIGGIWYQIHSVWHYKPSKFVLTKHTISELKSYFKAYEKDSILDI